MTKKTIQVNGMFCENCEKRIRNRLLQIRGVETVFASFVEEHVQVQFDPELISLDSIEESIEELGYEIDHSNSRNTQILSILVIILATYVIAKHLGWLQIFNIFPSIETSISLGMLFVIGVLTSVHCIAMCGGISLTHNLVSVKNKQSLIKSNLEYQLGRVISYTLIGGIVGGIGNVLSLSGIFSGLFSVLAGIVMVIMALNMLGVQSPFRQLRLHMPSFIGTTLSKIIGKRSSFAIGILNGFMPCGPLQSMQIYALSTGSVLLGASSMLLFCLGTVPLMVGFGLVSGKLNQKYSRYLLTVSAILVFVMGIHMASNGLSLSGISIVLPSTNQNKMAMLDGEVQRITTEVDYGSYESFSVREGIPVEWIIVVPEGKLNGCNGEILVPKYGIDVKLHEGENTVRFIPEDPGIVPYSCWMGMIHSSIEVIENKV